MGAVGGMLGLNGGAGGSGFSTSSGTNAGQINQAYQGNQAAMNQQNALLTALQGQGGLQKQTDVYGQLQGVASGQGPNPAQAMLNQATQANVANQAALMAGQRGAAANPGLMARQAAQQGGNLQQQAVGQGATMQANQSLGALGQAGNMAENMAANQIGQTNSNVTAQQNEQNILQGANTANNQIQGGMAQTQMQGGQKIVGGLMNSGAAMAGMLAGGGQIPQYAGGGAAFGPQSMFVQSMGATQPGNFQSLGALGGNDPLTGAHAPVSKTSDPMTGATNAVSDASGVPGGAMDAGIGNFGAALAAHGGQVDIMVSPGEKILNPGEARAVAAGKANPMAMGKQVPGKAAVSGDSYKNDNVHTKAEPGAVVIKRSMNKDADDAAAFVRGVMAKKKVRK